MLVILTGKRKNTLKVYKQLLMGGTGIIKYTFKDQKVENCFLND